MCNLTLRNASTKQEQEIRRMLSISTLQMLLCAGKLTQEQVERCPFLSNAPWSTSHQPTTTLPRPRLSPAGEGDCKKVHQKQKGSFLCMGVHIRAYMIETVRLQSELLQSSWQLRCLYGHALQTFRPLQSPNPNFPGVGEVGVDLQNPDKPCFCFRFSAHTEGRIAGIEKQLWVTSQNKTELQGNL